MVRKVGQVPEEPDVFDRTKSVVSLLTDAYIPATELK
jgi:hypothetical protein